MPKGIINRSCQQYDLNLNVLSKNTDSEKHQFYHNIAVILIIKTNLCVNIYSANLYKH